LASSIGFAPGQDPTAAPCSPDGSGGARHDLIPLAETDRARPSRAVAARKVNEHGITRFFRRSDDGWDIERSEAAHHRACRFRVARLCCFTAGEAVRSLFQWREHRGSLLLNDPGL